MLALTQLLWTFNPVPFAGAKLASEQESARQTGAVLPFLGTLHTTSVHFYGEAALSPKLTI